MRNFIFFCQQHLVERKLLKSIMFYDLIGFCFLIPAYWNCLCIYNTLQFSRSKLLQTIVLTILILSFGIICFRIVPISLKHSSNHHVK